MTREPNNKERRILQGFSGTPEPWTRFARAGPITQEALLVEGWIRHNTNPDYPKGYFEITPEGEEAATSA